MPELDIPEKLAFLLDPAPYKVAYGGRGGSKSWAFARVLLFLGTKKATRILCARELQTSIADSVHKLLSDQAEALGLGKFYIVQDKVIRGINGTEIIFSGLRNNITKIKSMEGIDIVWVEEAETVSASSWEVLIPTIRKDGSEIWVSFNTRESTDPTYKIFVENPRDGSIVVKVNWSDNPWFPERLMAEKDYLYRVDPDAAAHIWGGNCRSLGDAQVLRNKCSVETFEPRKDLWDGPYQGADWGFATDPSTLVRCWIWDRCLYVEHEVYGLGVETDHLSALFDSIPFARDYTTRADNARPETISFMIRAGWKRMQAASKWPGSVQDGVALLRSFDRIVIHPRCKHTQEESRLWSYKTDNLSGDVMPILIDKHNHCWDAIRYALEPVTKGYKRDRPLVKIEEFDEFSFIGGRGGNGSWMS